MTIRGGVLVIYGPAIASLLKRVPISGGAAAMTLGHTILAQSMESFQQTYATRMDPRTTVRAWGLLFLPAYACDSLYRWAVGGHPYLDNSFSAKCANSRRSVFWRIRRTHRIDNGATGKFWRRWVQLQKETNDYNVSQSTSASRSLDALEH